VSIVLPSVTDKFKVALFKDSAVDMTREEYNDYLKDCDLSKLKLVEGKLPTFFIMRKVLPAKLSKKVMAEQVTFHGGEAQFNFGSIVDVIKAAICGVENPPDVEESQRINFKADADGSCPDDIVAGLVSMQVHTDLFAAYQNVAGGVGISDTSKKN
jgi:hypothetical protein